MKIACLTSGGVDSAVSLALLKQQGFDVTAFYLKIWLEDEVAHLGDCAWETDLEYVEKTCEMLNVPLRVISLQHEYWSKVVAETIAEVKAGLTPNPDIWCNEKVKYGSFFDKIDDSFVKVATGHYAQVEQIDDDFWLKQAPDPAKDQTYFLSRLNQAQLSRAMFPIGVYPKSTVRDLAKQFDLPSQNRADSQGICFLGKFEFKDFLREHLGEQSGAIIDDETGETIGEHSGFWFFTIGQRQGLGLSGGPWYVAAKDAKENTIRVKRELPVQSGTKQFEIIDCNWIPYQPKEGRYSIKLRHGAQFVNGNFFDISSNTAQITLAKPDRGIAEGQSAVLYKNGYCLGGGMVRFT